MGQVATNNALYVRCDSFGKILHFGPKMMLNDDYMILSVRYKVC